MEAVGLLVAFLSVLVAIAVPLGIERARRPALRIKRADDANMRWRTPAGRLVHVNVINVPIAGWRGGWLLRNTATGCRVWVTFRSKSDGSVKQMDGRWSATPQPLTYAPGAPAAVFDLEKVPQTLRFDVPPDVTGEVVSVALKWDGEAQAWGFTSESYAHPQLSDPRLELPDEEYEVTVVARSGPAEVRRTFVLANTGTAHQGLQLSD